jgi:general secretion pathway protein G
MTRTPPSHSRRPTPRRGFTLIEHLVVITIIGVLVALLVPVIAGAVRQANEARVSSEVQLMVQGLAEFKNRYGDYFPSRIILSEDGVYPVTDNTLLGAYTGWIIGYNAPGSPIYGALPAGKTTAGADMTVGELAQRSVRFMRKFFAKATPPSVNPPVFHDFNGNGVLDAGQIYLEGHECLVFFLGGIPSFSGVGVSGFGRNPAFPFVSDNPGMGGTTNRTPALFDFQANRLVDEDSDGLPAFLDPQGSAQALPGEGNLHFYAYFSGYGGNQYDPNDVNFVEEPTPRRFATNPGYASIGGGTGVMNSLPPNPYTGSEALLAQGFANFINPNGFQIISAGSDGYYGPGGRYAGDTATDTLPLDADTNADTRGREHDNITNFARGRLQ